MSEAIDVRLSVDELHDVDALRRAVEKQLGTKAPGPIRVVRKAVDARHGKVRFVVRVSFAAEEELGSYPLEHVSGEPVVIVGTGPAGLFCAYELARHGRASVVLERGKRVQPRRHDLAALNNKGVVDVDSNYCFGEGGAGTYSDGKLYTRAKKRGDVRSVLEILVAHGAPRDILVDARPHIGSNLLPKVVASLRDDLIAHGVDMRFAAKVTGLKHKNGEIQYVVVGDEEIRARKCVLATGHSARGIWQILDEMAVTLEAKEFAMGVRIEHPQGLINRLQYGNWAGHENLPNASYRVAHQAKLGGVYSFCMCPGGFIVPAATEPGALVVNGMSLRRRDSPFANSGLVVGVGPYESAAAALARQRRLEERAFSFGGGHLVAPAQRADDFLAGRLSQDLPQTSYRPGVKSVMLEEVLEELAAPLKEALRVFESRMPGYAGHDALLVGVESRTSAPVRIPRHRDSLQSSIAGLYPCGEGAGYAGGIISAALDGVRVARAILRSS